MDDNPWKEAHDALCLYLEAKKGRRDAATLDLYYSAYERALERAQAAS